MPAAHPAEFRGRATKLTRQRVKPMAEVAKYLRIKKLVQLRDKCRLEPDVENLK
jgi:hypothetical protein